MYSSNLNHDHPISLAGDVLTNVALGVAEKGGRSAADLFTHDPAIVIRPYTGTLDMNERAYIASVAREYGLTFQILEEAPDVHTVRLIVRGDFVDPGAAAQALDRVANGLEQIWLYLYELWADLDWSVVFEADEEIYDKAA